jgi:hypothetical protein
VIRITFLVMAMFWIALFLSILVWATVAANEIAMAKCQTKHSYDVCFTTLN